MSRTQVVSIMSILLIVGLGSLLAQNTLPPDKQSIENQYAQERLAGVQNPAPKDPNAPFPIAPEMPFQTGIIDTCSPPFSSQTVNIVSCWQGIQTGIETAVYTGAEADDFDPQQGIVYIMTIPDFPADTSVQTVLTPVRAGAVRIVAAQNNVLTLVSATGSYVLTFNVSTGIFTSVVIDNTPPAISGMPNTNCTLWPVTEKLVQVATVTASDDTGIVPGSFRVTGSSNQPILSTDPMYPDILITPTSTGAFTIQLRADRLGNIATDRVYTLTATATDFVGNVATTTAKCVVPHDQSN